MKKCNDCENEATHIHNYYGGMRGEMRQLQRCSTHACSLCTPLPPETHIIEVTQQTERQLEPRRRVSDRVLVARSAKLVRGLKEYVFEYRYASSGLIDDLKQLIKDFEAPTLENRIASRGKGEV